MKVIENILVTRCCEEPNTGLQVDVEHVEQIAVVRMLDGREIRQKVCDFYRTSVNQDVYPCDPVADAHLDFYVLTSRGKIRVVATSTKVPL